MAATKSQLGPRIVINKRAGGVGDLRCWPRAAWPRPGVPQPKGTWRLHAGGHFERNNSVHDIPSKEQPPTEGS